MADENKIKDKFTENRVVFLSGDFEEENCQKLTKELLYLYAVDLKLQHHLI